jgi:hypothetical protein
MSEVEKRQADVDLVSEIPDEMIAAGIAITDDWIDENRPALEAGGDGDVHDLVERILALKPS